MNKLEILPVKKNSKTDSKKDLIPDPLLKPEFLWIIYAPVRSGKTNLIVNLLERPDFGYRKYFDTIMYISPTIENDITGVSIMKDDKIIKITDNLEGSLDDILEAIVIHRKKDKDLKPMLIVLDDCLGIVKAVGHSYFSNLCSRYRHWKLSLIITTQSFKAIPPTARYNATAYILFKTHNKKEYEKIEEELQGNFPNFSEIFHEATDEKYSFLYLNMEKIKAYRKFEELLYEK